MNLAALDLYAVVILVFLVVVVPLIGLWKNRRLARWTHAGRQDARLATYRWIMILEWTMALVMVGWWLQLGRGTAPLLLNVGFAGWRWLPVGLAAALVAMQVWQTRVALGKREELEKVRQNLGDLVILAPRDERELKVFAALSITAGICEEVIYRGVLMAVVTSVTGHWPALVVTSVVFGLGHAYQGTGGILKTAAVGLVMGLLTLFSGSLVPAMVLHAVIDLTAGQAMAAAVNLPAAAPASTEGEPA